MQRGFGDRMDLGLTVDALLGIMRKPSLPEAHFDRSSTPQVRAP